MRATKLSCIDKIQQLINFVCLYDTIYYTMAINSYLVQFLGQNKQYQLDETFPCRKSERVKESARVLPSL